MNKLLKIYEVAPKVKKTLSRHPPHIPVPSTIIVFIDTTVGMLYFLVSSLTFFIIIIGPTTSTQSNTIMVDGTGMCGGCRLSVDGKTKYACVDGPEFDGHKVDFDDTSSRLFHHKSVVKTEINFFEIAYSFLRRLVQRLVSWGRYQQVFAFAGYMRKSMSAGKPVRRQMYSQSNYQPLKLHFCSCSL